MKAMGSCTLQELADRIGGKAAGDPAFRIEGVGSLEGAGPGELAFLGDRRRAGELATTRAGALILPTGTEGFSGPRIECDNPYLAFARALAFFHPGPEVTAHSVHESALVGAGVVLEEPVHLGPGVVLEEGVRVGAGTRIEAGCVIGRSCRIGRRCRLHARVTLYHETILGDRVEIHSGAVLGSDGFGYARDGAEYIKFPQVGRVLVEDDVEIGAGTTIDRGALGDTRIKRGAKIDNLCQIAHNCVIGEDTALAAQVGVSGSTVIGARCMIGGQAGFAGHSRIGDEVQIAAQSGVHGDLPDGTAWFGSPAMPLKEGLRNSRAYARLHQLAQRVRRLEKQPGSNPPKPS